MAESHPAGPFAVDDHTAVRWFWCGVLLTLAPILLIRTTRWIHQALDSNPHWRHFALPVASSARGVYAPGHGASASPTSPTTPSNTRGRLQQSWGQLRRIQHRIKCCTLLEWSWSGPLSWLSPPPLGKVLLACWYWIACGALLLLVPRSPHGHVSIEPQASRAGWLAFAQLPLLVSLSGKLNMLALLCGISCERINWLHRCVARTLLALSTVHAIIYLALWTPTGFLETELTILPRVGHGIAAWALLLWITLSSLLPLRSYSYRFFIAQHIVSAIAVVILLWIHVTPNHRLLVSIAMLIWVVDILLRFGLLVYRGATAGRGRRFGYMATAVAENADVTIVDIQHPQFEWIPGQYVRLWIPSIPWHFTHPFTISNCHVSGRSSTGEAAPVDNGHDVLRLVIRTKSKRGLTHRINNRALSGNTSTSEMNPGGQGFKVFLLGPFGRPPTWLRTQGAQCIMTTIFFISASTGAAFTLPLLSAVLGRYEEPIDTAIHKSCVVLLLARDRSHVQFFLDQVPLLRAQADRCHIKLRITLAITTGGQGHDQTRLLELGHTDLDCLTEANLESFVLGDDDSEDSESLTQTVEGEGVLVAEKQEQVASDTDEDQQEERRAIPQARPTENQSTKPSNHCESRWSNDSHVSVVSGRPDLGAFMSAHLSAHAGGMSGVETDLVSDVGIVACGGAGLARGVRRAVRTLDMTVLPMIRDVKLHIEQYE